MGPQRTPLDSIRHTCMHACPSCPSHPKCTIVPQRIPRNSIMYTCMYILCQAKLYVPSQMYYGFCKVHTHLHMSTLTIPSQMYYGTSKNPTGFHKVHMHARISKLSIHPKCTSKNPTGFYKVHACTHVHAVCPIPNILPYGTLKKPIAFYCRLGYFHR